MNATRRASSTALAAAALAVALLAGAPPATGAPPAPGDPFRDPVAGQTLERLSDASARGGFESQVYSQLQAFSRDRRHVLLASPGGYLVRRVRGGRRLRGLRTGTWNVPRWDPRRRRAIIHFDSNDDATLRLQRTDVARRRTRTILRFPRRFERIRPNQSFDELSRDGRWLAGMASGRGGEQILFAVDVRRRRLRAHFTLSSLYRSRCRPDPEYGELEPDWVGVSPRGRYMVVQWVRDGTAPCSGLETYSLRTGRYRGRVYDGHQHGDLGLAADGRTEIFMTFELHHPSGDLHLGQRRLPGPRRGVATPRYLARIPWDAGGHVSCQGPRGACLVSAGADPSNGLERLEGELFLQYTNGRVRRLARHRSTSCGYWAQPRATWSRDGRLAIFASDWGAGRGDCSESERSDPYLVRVPRSFARAPAR